MVVQGYLFTLHEIKYKLKCAKTGVDYVPDSFTLEISNRQLIYWLVPDIFLLIMVDCCLSTGGTGGSLVISWQTGNVTGCW